MGNDLLCERHFFFYAKGHYLQRDMLEDVRALVANYVAMLPVHVTDNDVVSVLCDVAIPYLLKSSNPVEKVRKLICGFVETSQRGNFLTVTDIVSEMLAILRSVSVRVNGKEVIRLGEPDYTLLADPHRLG